jgi:hypothetical protein
MQLTPEGSAGQRSVEIPPLPEPPPRQGFSRSRVWGICFTIFCLEIGAFLTVFPWLDSWQLNHFPTMFPSLLDLWNDPYFRGAVSGLGLVNLMIAAAQANHLLRRGN